jgi:tRNA-modifying protein YgfZ
LNQHKVLANHDYGVPAVEVVDGEAPEGAEPVAEEDLERLRILARTPRLGRELDDRVMPAEAGLEQRAISFTKGCYPGQEPVARLHFRGHPNRGLRVLALDDGELPDYDAELAHEGKAVGRITSVARDAQRGIVALAYVRREIPAGSRLELRDGRAAWPLGETT